MATKFKKSPATMAKVKKAGFGSTKKGAALADLASKAKAAAMGKNKYGGRGK